MARGKPIVIRQNSCGVFSPNLDGSYEVRVSFMVKDGRESDLDRRVVMRLTPVEADLFAKQLQEQADKARRYSQGDFTGA